jgi:hypothetical protein
MANIHHDFSLFHSLANDKEHPLSAKYLIREVPQHP